MTDKTFTAQERADAMRRTAAWCREGAPGGQGGSLFSDGGPCALGKALLELENDVELWLKRACTTTAILTLSGVRGFGHGGVPELQAVAPAFDAACYTAAAEALEAAAEAVECSV